MPEILTPPPPDYHPIRRSDLDSTYDLGPRQEVIAEALYRINKTRGNFFLDQANREDVWREAWKMAYNGAYYKPDRADEVTYGIFRKIELHERGQRFPHMSNFMDWIWSHEEYARLNALNLRAVGMRELLFDAIRVFHPDGILPSSGPFLEHPTNLPIIKKAKSKPEPSSNPNRPVLERPQVADPKFEIPEVRAGIKHLLALNRAAALPRKLGPDEIKFFEDALNLIQAPDPELAHTDYREVLPATLSKLRTYRLGGGRILRTANGDSQAVLALFRITDELPDIKSVQAFTRVKPQG